MSAPIFIRPFRLQDFPRLLEIEDACFGEDGYDRKLFAGFYRKRGCPFIVALEAGKVCGYMLTCIGGRSARYRAEIISIAVAPEHRGKGISKILMDATIRRVRRQGVIRLNLMVKVTNAPAIALYEKYGFELGRIWRQYYEDGTDGRRMSKFWR